MDTSLCPLEHLNSFYTAMNVDGLTIAVRARVSTTAAANFLEAFSLPFGQKPIADNWPSRYGPLSEAPLVRSGKGTYFAHLVAAPLWAIHSNLERRLKDAGLWQKYERHRSRGD